METEENQDPPISFEKLHEKYPLFFQEAKRTRPKSAHSFFMSLDAEWYAAGERNVVLSYQIATSSETCTNNIFIRVENGQRLTLSEIVNQGIQSVTSKEAFNDLRGNRIAVILISHFVVAEWSVLADRDEPHITARISPVRGQPITDSHPIKIIINESFPALVRIFDTSLLAPAKFQSLKKLSSLLGEKDSNKIKIKQHYIENMNLLWDEDPDLFKRYALKDSEITLKLFFVLQEALNKLVKELTNTIKNKTIVLYRTLAIAGVKSFTDKNDEFDKYRKALKYKHSGAQQLVTRGYYGGRNESFFIGRTKNYPQTKNKIWLDIDFIGCYPTAMALSPLIDLEKEPKYISRTYKIDDQAVTALLNEKVPEEIIFAARDALLESREAFDRLLMNLSDKKMSFKIRKTASTHNNELVDCWFKRWDQTRHDDNASVKRVSIPGFARIQFKFPKNTQFPCLPIRHFRYGLLYVLEGETVASAAEIMLAIEAGAEIRALSSVEFSVKEKDGQPIKFLLSHLAGLADKRNKYKPGEPEASPVMENLLKEFTNSFYGKISQGINRRHLFKPSTWEKSQLKESLITEPCTAALATSLPRAALSATLLGIERFNKEKDPADQITVISATTDGILIGVPTPENYTVVDDYYDASTMELKKDVKNQLKDILSKFGCSEVWDLINEFLPIKQMQNARDEMVSSEEIFEIKHIADEIISIKNRGQIGKLSTGQTVLLARFNLKVPLSEIFENDREEYKRIMEESGIERNSIEAEWILDKLDKIENGEDEIQKYSFITINKFTKIYQSFGNLDHTKHVSLRQINSDFDWKRKLVLTNGKNTTKKSILPFTVPFQTREDMGKYRRVVEGIRRSGKVARPEIVLQNMVIKKMSLNNSGGEPVAVTRIFLRGLESGKIIVQQKSSTRNLAANKINKIWELNNLTEKYPKMWDKNDFKYADKKGWEPSFLIPNVLTIKLVADLALEFTADPVAVREAIFAAEEYKEPISILLEYVITAIENGPRMGIYPFTELNEQQFQLIWERLWEVFSNQLSEEQIDFCKSRPFIPGQLPPYKAKPLEKIFRQLAVPRELCPIFARSLAPRSTEIRIKHRNPHEASCTNYFIQAISQADIRNRELKITDIIRHLYEFNVTKHKYYQEKNKRFNNNCVPNTPENRLQISRMAKAIGHDPGPLLEVLIER